MVKFCRGEGVEEKIQYQSHHCGSLDSFLWISVFMDNTTIADGFCPKDSFKAEDNSSLSANLWWGVINATVDSTSPSK